MQSLKDSNPSAWITAQIQVKWSKIDCKMCTLYSYMVYIIFSSYLSIKKTNLKKIRVVVVGTLHIYSVYNINTNVDVR